MERPFTALVVEPSERSRNVSPLQLRASIVGIVVVFTALLLVVAAAPTFVSFPMAAAIAIAWCVWLERHPEEAVDTERRAYVARRFLPVNRVMAGKEHPWDRV